MCCDSAGCADGEIRPLIGGASPNEGVVEVCSNGLFRPVSLSSFTVAEASVVCRQLNLSTGMWLVMWGGISGYMCLHFC